MSVCVSWSVCSPHSKVYQRLLLSLVTLKVRGECAQSLGGRECHLLELAATINHLSVQSHFQVSVRLANTD